MASTVASPTQFPPQLVPETQLSPVSYTPAPPSYDGLYSSKGSGPYQAVQPVYAAQQQPQHIVDESPPDSNPRSFFIYSIICVFLSAVCGWPFLACTIPALTLSFMSREYSARGNWKLARSYGKLAFWFNTAAVIAFVLSVVLIIVISVETDNE